MKKQNTQLQETQEKAAQTHIIEQVIENTAVRTVAIIMATVSFLVWHYTTVVLPLQRIDSRLAAVEKILNNDFASIVKDNQTAHIEVDRKITLLMRNQDKLCDFVKIQCLEVR